MTESNIRPAPIHIRKAHRDAQDWLYIYLRSDVSERTETDEMSGEEMKLYSYDEEHVRIPLPDGVAVDVPSDHSVNQDALKAQLKDLFASNSDFRTALQDALSEAQLVDWRDRVSEWSGPATVDIEQGYNWAAAECVLVAPQDVSGLETEIVGEYKQLIDIGDYRLWAVNAPVGTLKALHNELWAMPPTETLGVLSVVKAHSESWMEWAVVNATDKAMQQVADQRNTIANYFDAQGYDGDPVRAATNEAELIAGIVEGLGYTMQQLWNAMVW